MTTSSGLTDGSAPPARQFCVVDAVTPSSGISIRTSRDSSPSGQITTVASKLASVQIWPLASGAARISGRSAGLTALLPSAQYIILDDYGTAGEDTKWVICFAAVGLRKEEQQQKTKSAYRSWGRNWAEVQSTFQPRRLYLVETWWLVWWEREWGKCLGVN